MDYQNHENWLENGKFCVRKGNTSLPKYEDLTLEGENWDNELEPFISKKYCAAVSEINVICVWIIHVFL